MGWRHRGFHVDEAEVGFVEDVAHVAEERAPACGVGGVAGRGSRGGGGADRFVGNHIACHGKADLS